MKLTPAHRIEVERLVNAFHDADVPRYAVEDRISPRLDQIFACYGLDSSSALDCTDRVLGASDEFTLEDILAIDQRTPDSLLQAMRHERLADGRMQLHLDGERPLEKFAPRARWSAHDAAEMPRLMSAFFESPYGLLNVHESLLRAEIDTSRHRSLTHAMTAGARNFWSHEDLMVILAKDSFVDMLEAAAVTAPTGPLSEEELLSPAGALFFEKERLVTAIIDPRTPTPVRGLTWDIRDGRILIEVLIDGHYELNNVAAIEPPTQCYEYLYSMKSLRTEMWHPHAAGDEESIDTLLGFVRAIKAIAQSPVTEDAATRPMKKARARKANAAATAGRRTPAAVRVLTLRNAEHGRYELDAATGRKIRQHWVRGHWRNQWYASLEAHRPIWIDGFIKGDASAGIVTGTKVHVAR